MDLFNLKGKTAVMLGGGGVLGAAMAEGLADAGADLAICDLYPERHRLLRTKQQQRYQGESI